MTSEVFKSTTPVMEPAVLDGEAIICSRGISLLGPKSKPNPRERTLSSPSWRGDWLAEPIRSTLQYKALRSWIAGCVLRPLRG